jgi:hypothetical protein
VANEGERSGIVEAYRAEEGADRRDRGGSVELELELELDERGLSRVDRAARVARVARPARGRERRTVRGTDMARGVRTGVTDRMRWTMDSLVDSETSL